MNNILFVISGPSGVGKGTISNMLVNENEHIIKSISCTTRAKRDGEVDGEDYFFISKLDFLGRVAMNELLEYSEHFDKYYGTPRSFIIDKLRNYDVLLEIDVNGAKQVKGSFPSAVLIMIVPPKLDDLKSRLEGRGTETEEQIATRLSRCKYELEKTNEYDYVVVNDDIETAKKTILNIIEAERNRTTRCTNMLLELIGQS